MRATEVLAIVLLVIVAATPAACEDLRGLLSRAAASEAAGKLTEAEAIYLEALTGARSDGERAEVISRLGEVRRRRGDTAGALAAYRQCLELQARGGWMSRCLMQLAGLARQQGETEVARSAYTRLLADFADEPGLTRQAATSLARLERDAGDLAAAIKRLEGLLAADSDAGHQVQRMLVEYLIEAEGFDRAVEVARRGAKGDPQRTDLMLRTSSALMDAGRLERAEGLCRDVLAEEPGNEPAGRLLYEISSERGAVDKLKEELLGQAQGPQSTIALRRLAQVYSQEGDDDRALAIYERLLEAAPDDVELLYRAGSLATNTGDPLRSEQHLTRLLALEPDHRSAAQLLGEVYIRRGEAEKALETSRRPPTTAPTTRHRPRPWVVCWSGTRSVTRPSRSMSVRASSSATRPCWRTTWAAPM